jgi:hypothetical protein
VSTLNELATAIRTNAIKKGFWDKDRNFGEMIALIHSEASEALEEHRAGKPALYVGDHGKPEGWAIEIIDVMIRCLDTIGPGHDIDTLMRAKMEYNATRPKMHGKAY